MKNLIRRTEQFLRNMRWKAFWAEKKGISGMDDKENSDSNDIISDFKSTKTPPQHELLKPFERDMYNLIGNIQFRKVSDPTAREMNDEVAKIGSSNKVIVNADKTGNKYEMTASDYKQLMHDNLTQDYKLDNSNKLAEINEDTKKHARSLQIIDRMERHSESNAFLTIKDHKPDFPNTIKCRIINPASNNLGKVSKRVLDKINTK